MSELAIRQEHLPTPTTLTNDQLKFIASSEFVPTGLRGNLPAILACVATGRELGIGDLTALRSIHIIEGKATFSAELMVQLVRKRGHSITGEVTEGSATVTGTRADNGDTMTAIWTVAMAERAGLLNKQNWRKYPEAMLWARAASQLCRMLFADCFAGATYTTEELGADDTEANGAPYVDSAAGTPFAEDAVPFVDMITEPQERKLNVLVGTLRDAGHITTESLWKEMRPEDEGNWPRDLDGGLHWSDLRPTLSKAEASALIERLTKLEEDAGTSSAGGPSGPDVPADEAQTSQSSPSASSPAVITDDQFATFTETARAHGLTRGAVKKLVEEHTGQDQVAGILADRFADVLAAIERVTVEA